jgi:uncharacterized membrane protein
MKKSLMVKLALFGFVLIAFNILLMVAFGRDAKLYTTSVATIFLITQTIIYVVAIVVFILLIRSFSSSNKKT